MRLTHEMPVTLPVKKYLEYWKPSCYAAVMDDFLGMWLMNALTRKTMQVQVFSANEMKRNGYEYVWRFSAPSRDERCMVMPRRRAYEFNSMIRQLMYFELISDIEALQLKGGEVYLQQALNDFRDRYDLLEKDLPDDRLRKMYHRFRERGHTLREENGKFWSGMLFGKINMSRTKVNLNEAL